MNIDYKALGKRIADIRKQHNLTQEQLAEKTDLSNIYISHIENARSIPSLETLIKLCDALGTTPDGLLLGTSQSAKEYLMPEVASRLLSCTPKERRMVSCFIEMLIRERDSN